MYEHTIWLITISIYCTEGCWECSLNHVFTISFITDISRGIVLNWHLRQLSNCPNKTRHHERWIDTNSAHPNAKECLLHGSSPIELHCPSPSPQTPLLSDSLGLFVFRLPIRIIRRGSERNRLPRGPGRQKHRRSILPCRGHGWRNRSVHRLCRRRCRCWSSSIPLLGSQSGCLLLRPPCSRCYNCLRILFLVPCNLLLRYGHVHTLNQVEYDVLHLLQVVIVCAEVGEILLPPVVDVLYPTSHLNLLVHREVRVSNSGSRDGRERLSNTAKERHCFQLHITHGIQSSPPLKERGEKSSATLYAQFCAAQKESERTLPSSNPKKTFSGFQLKYVNPCYPSWRNLRHFCLFGNITVWWSNIKRLNWFLKTFLQKLNWLEINKSNIHSVGSCTYSHLWYGGNHNSWFWISILITFYI